MSPSTRHDFLQNMLQKNVFKKTKIDSKKKKLVDEGCIQIPSENDADPQSQPPEPKNYSLTKERKESSSVKSATRGGNGALIW